MKLKEKKRQSKKNSYYYSKCQFPRINCYNIYFLSSHLILQKYFLHYLVYRWHSIVLIYINFRMDENFTNNAEAVYLASLTQQKKILFLERQLANCEMYTKNLEQDLEATKLTINRLIKQRTNNEVLAKMSENIHRMERRHQEVQQILKQNNAKLLIQMQLRIQQKLQYTQKIREMQEQIDSIRKTNKDKQQEFSIIVNKLRKYEDIRQLMIQNKINLEAKKQLAIRDDDKDQMIKQIAEELGRHKVIHKQYHQDLDRKIGVFAYALENRANYQDLRDEFNFLIREQTKSNQLQKVVQEKIIKDAKISDEEMKIKQKRNLLRDRGRGDVNFNQTTKQLIKQLKKLVIANKLLEAALNDSIEKNKQLIINQKIVTEANLMMRKQLQEYRKKETRIRKMGLIRSSSRYKMMGEFEKQLHQAQGLKRSQTFKYQKQLSVNQCQDDFTLNLQKQVPELMKQKKLKQYLETLKSKDYQVNIENLCTDVRRMGEFLILCLGNRSKDTPYLKYNNINTTYKIKKPNQLQDEELKNNDRNTYLRIKQRKDKMKRIKSSRSLSFDIKDEHKNLDLRQEKEKEITQLPIQSNFIRKGNKSNKNNNQNIVKSRTQGQRKGGLRKFTDREDKKQIRHQAIKQNQLMEKNPYGLSFVLRTNKLQMSNGQLEHQQGHIGDTSLKIQEF